MGIIVQDSHFPDATASPHETIIINVEEVEDTAIDIELQPQKLNIAELIKDGFAANRSIEVSDLGEYVARLIIANEDVSWHLHSSHTFCFVVSGSMWVDFADRTEFMSPGQMLTVPKYVKHRVRINQPVTALCFESKAKDHISAS